jgi:hypothetical protein
METWGGARYSAPAIVVAQGVSGENHSECSRAILV